METAAYLGDGLQEQFLVALVQFSLVFVGERLVYRAVCDVHIVHERVALVVIIVYCKDVNVRDCMAHHLALGAELLHQQVLLLQFFGVLKAQFLGGFLHLSKEMVRHLARVSFQYLACTVYHLAVFLQRLPPNARPAAVVDMVIQARFVLSCGYPLSGQGQSARAGMIELLYQLQDGVHASEVGIGAEIRAILPVYGACLKDTWELFVCDTDGRVGLSVLQQHVVSRVILLDKRILQQQRILFAVHDGVGDIVNLAHQHLRLKAIHLL